MNKAVDESNEVIATRRNSELVVTMSLARYRSMEETDYLLSSPGDAECLRDALD
ncbi:MAG: type II toxin-antitoxin system Phd/YefM family antitoxin [Pontixanthobacter sp.]